MHKHGAAGPSTPVWVAFGLMLGLILLAGFVLYGNAAELVDSSNWVNHTYEVSAHLETMRADLASAESATRGYVLLKRPDFRAAEKAYADAAGEELKEIDNLTRDNTGQQAFVQRLRPLVSRRLALLQAAISGKDAPTAGPQINEGSAVMSQIERLIGQMQSAEQQLLLKRSEKNIKDWQRAQAAFWMGIGIQVIALFALLVLANRVIRYQYQQRMTEATNRVELERQVSARTAELKASNEELEGFSAAVSHDLRAPLRHVDAIAATLREDGADRLSPEQDSALVRLRKEVKSMSLIIEDLLRLSKTARGEVTLEHIDMGKLAEEEWQSLEERYGRSQASFTTQPGLIAEADASMVRILLDNLLSNARKYSSKAEHPAVEFGETEREGVRTFYVRDNGAGFNPAYAPRLFQPFSRLHSDKEFEGSGLGLAICRRIVNRHGGRIWAESEPGHGATFFFTLQPPIASLPLARDKSPSQAAKK